MTTSFTPERTQSILTQIQQVNASIARYYPGDSPARQPIHTVYGGAQIFKADTATKLGLVALRSLGEYAATPAALAKALKLEGSSSFHKLLYQRVVEKLNREPVEDFRIDFEDGYGNRSDAEEDGHAQSTAEEVVRGMKEGTLPPFIGIRIKPFSEDLKARSICTLDIFISTLVAKSNGALPDNFVVTLPKVIAPEQVTALVRLLENLELRCSLPAGSLKLEIMVETPQSIINSRGECALPMLVLAGAGRCIAAHFGVYDYTASMNITAAYQTMDHPACDFARHMMKVSLAGTGVWISDGATNVLPVGSHRAVHGKKLTPKQLRENRESVHRAWRLGYAHIVHSLRHGYYQGWDLHPAQLPIRYAAVYKFFTEGLDAASVRLKTFVEKAAQASLIGGVFDDAATGQGLLNYFLRGMNCGAITEEETKATGLTLEEIRSRSFFRILEGRRKR
ncbi:MAG: phosphoenolpyruvate kinase [Ignavibacteria bacterium]|nr:phosphoenolpyruvate kinase [Ignavibacteria bacterium]